MKKLFSILLLAAVVVVCAAVMPLEVDAATIVDSGTCGSYATWKLDSEGVLTISGSGSISSGSSMSWNGRHSSIKKVVIGNYITSIGPNAFRDCNNLATVQIGSAVYTIGQCAFTDCTKLTNISWGSSVETIGQQAFAGCKSLEKIVIPSSVTTISSGMFMNCSKLNSVVFVGNVTSIGQQAFYQCTALNWIKLPESLTAIGELAFCSSGLESITIGSNLKRIDADAFMRCANLTKINLPKTVTYIGQSPFLYCPNLRGIFVDPANPNYCNDSYGVLYNKDKTTLIQAPGALSGTYVIPNSTTKIEEYAFAQLTGLQSVSVPNHVSDIGASAFYYCSQLSTINLPTELSAIKAATFAGCRKLTSIVFPDNIETIGSNAFLSCGLNGEITFPEKLSSIDYRAFCNCNIDSIVFSGEVPTIDENAFDQVSADVYTLVAWNSESLQPYGGTLIWHSGAIRISSGLNRDIYNVGESLLPHEMQVILTFDDGKEITVFHSTRVILGAYDNSFAGTKTVQINYCNQTCDYVYQVVDNWNINDHVAIVLENLPYYTGSPIEAKPTVSVNGITLTEGIHYTLSYENNINSGHSAIIRVAGLGSCAELSASKVFDILRADISGATITANTHPEYTGEYRETELMAIFNNNVLVEGVDYITRYYNNVNIGQATVKLIGIGNYCGEHAITFNIKSPYRLITVSNGFTTKTLNYVVGTSISSLIVPSKSIFVTGECSLSLGSQVLHHSVAEELTSSLAFPIENYILDTAGIYTLDISWTGYNVYESVVESGDASYTIVVSDPMEIAPSNLKIIEIDSVIHGQKHYMVVATGSTFAPTDVTWESSDETIATVENGTVIFKKAGTITLKATCKGVSAVTTATIQQRSINNAHVVGYDSTTRKATIFLDGQQLIQGRDFTVYQSRKGTMVIVEITGCNLYFGSLSYNFVLEQIPGDIDGNEEVDSDDVVQLLLHISMPDLFPIEADADFTGDGKVTSDDVVQLLLHISMPDMFPLEAAKKKDLII